MYHCFDIDEEDADLDIAKEGASIRTSADQKPICNSEDHKANTTCQRPVCNSEDHKAVGLEQRCQRPICNSESHKKVGLDQDCNPICNSEEHEAIGLQKECSLSRAPDVAGSALNKAWMYDGQTWNDIASMSVPRDRPACTLVQTSDGAVSSLC